MWQVWINIFFGLWFFLSGIPGLYIPANPYFMGIVFFIAGIAYLRWPGFVIAAIGALTVLSAHFDFMQIPIVFIIVGLLVTIFSLVQIATN